MRRVLFLLTTAIWTSPAVAGTASFRSSNPDRSFGIGAAIAALFAVVLCVVAVQRARRTGYAFNGFGWIDRRQSPQAFRTVLAATAIGGAVVVAGLVVTSVLSLLHH